MIDPIHEARALIAKAGMSSFSPELGAFAASADPLYPTAVVPLILIQPIVRGIGVPNFNKQRALNILDAIRNNHPLPPVRVYASTAAPY
jgi:hypothetical protein